MSRDDLERLSKEELIELVLRLQRPEKTSRTSSKPPASDRKDKREDAKPGGAKPGHEGHSRTLSEQPDRVIDHRPQGTVNLIGSGRYKAQKAGHTQSYARTACPGPPAPRPASRTGDSAPTDVDGARPPA